ITHASTTSSVVTLAGASSAGSVPEPPISRTIFRKTALPARLLVISVWWSIPRGNSQSAAARTSTSALGNAFWRSQVSPSRPETMQARRLGRPSIRMLHDAQCPSRQKSPRGRWYLGERPSVRMPAANSAAATGSPACAGTVVPSKSIATGAPAGDTPANPRRVGFTRDTLTHGREQPSLRAALAPYLPPPEWVRQKLSDFDIVDDDLL